MSWFNKNEYKTFLKQRLKEEKKRFKVALDIEKYRIKKSNCLEYILNQIDLKINRYIKELPRTGYFIIEDYSLPEYIKRTKFLFFTLRNEREHDKEIFEEDREYKAKDQPNIRAKFNQKPIWDDKIAEGFIKEYPDKKFRNSIKYQNSYI